MVLVSKSGQMEQSMRENGSSTKLTAKASSGMLTETSIRANGRMIKLMAMVSIPTLMEQSTKVNG